MYCARTVLKREKYSPFCTQPELHKLQQVQIACWRIVLLLCSQDVFEYLQHVCKYQVASVEQVLTFSSFFLQLLRPKRSVSCCQPELEDLVLTWLLQTPCLSSIQIGTLIMIFRLVTPAPRNLFTAEKEEGAVVN